MVEDVGGAANAAGGSPDDEASASPSVGAPAVDTEPPSIVQTLPAANAAGVTSGEIVIRFSEPMDPLSVESQLQGAETTGFAWDETGAVLTIRSELQFRSANEPPPDSDRPTCVLDIFDSAQDLAGNRLSAPFQLQFQPAVLVTQSFDLYTTLRGHAEGTYILAGDTSANVVNMGLLAFDLSAVPATLLSVLHAELTLSVRNRADSQMVFGDPLRDLGDLLLDHAEFFERSRAAYAPAAKLGDLGVVFSSGAMLVPDEPFDIAVTEAVADDLANRAVRQSRSEYRLRFEATTDNDGQADDMMFWNYPTVHSSCGGVCPSYQVPQLTIGYFIP